MKEFSFGEMLVAFVVGIILGIICLAANMDDWTKVDKNELGLTTTFKTVPYKLVRLQ
jgi:ABC-type arginine transport system permease subunit